MSTPQTSSPLPPHTVRIKRKRNQDPLQALLLGQGSVSKRSRTNSYVFKLAATEEAPRHAGAITLLEAPPHPREEETKEVSNILKEAARKVLNPARLFRFPTRKRQAEGAPLDSNERASIRPPPERTTPTPKLQPQKQLSPVPIKVDEQSVPVSQKRNEIPKVKVLDRSPPERPIAVPHSAAPLRRRRSSTASLSLSPTSSYQMATANEDELQKMVDQYLQLNKVDDGSKPSTALKRPHHHTVVDALREQQQQQSISGATSPAHKARHITGTESHMAAQNQILAQKLEAAAQQSQAKAGSDPTRILVSGDATADPEMEDYVYDVYYREKFLGNAWDGGQYGLLLYNSDIDFEDLLYDEYDEDEEVRSDDEDSNAEDFYRNDYPDEDEGDEENAFLSSSLDSHARVDDEVDADDFDEYDYDRCYQRFADDDGDRSIEMGATLDDIIGTDDDGNEYAGGTSSAGGYDAEDDDLDDSDRYRTRPRQWIPRSLTSDFADDEGAEDDDDDSDY